MAQTSTAGALPAPLLAPTRPARGRLREVAHRVLRHRSASIGLAILAVVFALALAAPLVAPYDPIEQNVALGLAPPSAAHPLGTDEFGRDILSRLIWGARISLAIAFVAVGIAALLGTLLGTVAGFLGGWVDELVMRGVDVALAFPGILLALVLAAILGNGMPSLMLAVGLAGAPTFVRVVRGSVLSAKQNEYVEAARCLGCGTWRLMWRHVLPNVLGPVIVLSTLYVAFAVLTASSLSFLGVGVQPPTPEWGAMANAGRHILRIGWWVSTFPGLAIMLVVLAFNLVGDGLRDALDPNLRIP